MAMERIKPAPSVNTVLKKNRDKNPGSSYNMFNFDRITAVTEERPEAAD